MNIKEQSLEDIKEQSLEQIYRQHPAMNQSLLKLLLKSESHFRWGVDKKSKTTDAMKLGRGVHLLVLQPHLSHLIGVEPKIDGTTRLGKIWKFLKEGKPDKFFIFTNKKKKEQDDDFYEVSYEECQEIYEMRRKYDNIINPHPDSIFLTQDQFDIAKEMWRNVFKNTDAYAILKACTEFEKIFYWNYFDIDMKGMLDGIGDNFVLDFKSTSEKDLSDRNIQYIIEKEYNYDFQAAHYLAGSGKSIYYIIFAQSVEPYLVAPYQLKSETILKGFEKLDRCCEIYKNCLINNPEFITNRKLSLI